MAKITFIGAANTVTGSKHLLEAAGKKILLDSGLFQGIKKLREKNWQPLPVDEKDIDAVVCSHAHIDHTGYFPKLVKNGFKGKIYATPPTCDMVKLLLLDSARLQEEEANYANKKKSSKHIPALPLYTEEDARSCLSRFVPIEYETPFTLFPGIDVKFREAGHILGSSMPELELEEKGVRKTLLFTGDLGRIHTPILQDPAKIRKADFLIMESTYGDRLHDNPDRKGSLAKVILETIRRDGVLVIPAFAVERTQEILYITHLLKQHRDIPDVPIYVDSPMAIGITKIFSKYSGLFDEEAREIVANPSYMSKVKFCETVKESKEINSHPAPMIIISASGMATGGRVLHHLMHRLGDKKNTILLIGYQAEGTRGRLLQQGVKTLKIYGDQYAVKAKIATLDGFSSHADYNEMLDWMRHFKQPPEKTFLVHGEPKAQTELKTRIEDGYGWNVRIPRELETVELF